MNSSEDSLPDIVMPYSSDNSFSDEEIKLSDHGVNYGILNPFMTRIERNRAQNIDNVIARYANQENTSDYSDLDDLPPEIQYRLSSRNRINFISQMSSDYQDSEVSGDDSEV